MAGSFVRFAFRALFCVYAAALACWLLLGLLPTVAQSVGAVHGALSHLAAGSGPVAAGAGRVLSGVPTMTPMAGTPGRVVSGGPMMAPVAESQAVLEYGFSLLNVGLGVALFARRPDALVPRLLAFALLGTAATFNATSHRAFHILGNPWPIAALHFTFHIVSGVCYLWAVVVFPDGRPPKLLRALPGPGWLWVGAVSAAVALICWRSSFLAHPLFFVVFFGVVVSLAGWGAQLLRMADPATSAADLAVSRLLIAGLLPALATSVVFVGSWLVSLVVVRGTPFGAVATAAQTIFPAAFALVPIVLCAAMIRYRLWDLDRFLARILVYGVVGGVAGGVYLLVVMAAGELSQDRLWWSVIALALVVAAFEPLRRTAGEWANRVVYGQVTSPAQALQELATGMAVLTPAGGLQQIERVAVATTRASAAALYLLDGDRLVGATTDTEIGLADPGIDQPVLEELLGPDTWPVTYHGELLGALTVSVPPGAPLTVADRLFLADIAAHAGLLLHNAVLGVALARQAKELAASAAQLRATRRLLVEAFDQERRSLERDLHDGAQQELVAGIIGLRTLAHSPEAAAELVVLQQVLGAAEQRLTQVATGTQPAELSRLGLAGALREAAGIAAVSGLQVRVDAVDVSAAATPDAAMSDSAAAWDSVVAARGWREAETAVYFCCLEALQNAAKYARATSVEVSLVWDREEIRFAVSDDGCGFDPSAVREASSGIAGLVRRLTLAGGSMVVESAPGRGTRVSGSVPGDRVRETAG